MMVLSFEGARSGKAYSFPVGYAEDERGLVTFTRFRWWKNFREARPVSVRLRGREVPGFAFAERDPERVRERFLLPEAQPARRQVLQPEGGPGRQGGSRRADPGRGPSGHDPHGSLGHEQALAEGQL